MADRRYHVTLTGMSPLLMHSDDIEWSDRMKAWTMDPKNTGTPAGDDRYPAYRWLGSLYHDGTHIALPADNVMACMRLAGGQFPTGKGKKTFKAQTQSGCIPEEVYWRFAVNGGEPISTAIFFADMGQRSYDAYQRLAEEHGFLLFLKRARIGRAKHVRVRPRFNAWHASGTLLVTDDEITQDVLTRILEYAGRRVGIGDWRAGCPTPGPWGKFTVSVEVA